MTRLLKNCDLLVRRQGKYEVIKNGFVAIDQEVISYVGAYKPEKKFDEEKDMKGRLVMAGLVNAHAHGPMTLVRGAGSGLPLQEWLNDAIFPIEAKMKPEDIAAGMEWAVIEMLASGITCTAEMYDFPKALGEVLKKSGMKADICRVGLSFSSEEEIPPRRFEECVELIQSFEDKSGRVHPVFCLHSEYLTEPKFVEKIARANESIRRSVHVHVSETRREHEECIARHGKTPMAYLRDLGILDQNCYAAHCVWVDYNDLQIMKEKHVSLVHNPSSNMKLGSGFAPVKEALDMGINVALGTDGVASNNNLNMFEELHIASLIHKGYMKDPTVLSVDQLLDMATLNGAKALGRENTGELAAGKKADLIALDLSKPHLFPAFDIPSLLCYSVQASDVVMTMVDGRILYEDGKYFTMDVEKAKYDMQQAFKRIY